MEPFQTEEKGLFTFYREQADFQELVKCRKAKKLHNEVDQLKQKDVKNIGSRIDGDKKNDKKGNKTSNQIIRHQQYAQNGSKDSQDTGKIIQLLEKHKYKHNYEKNFKIIMNSNEQVAKQYEKSNSKQRLLQKMNNLKNRQKQSHHEFERYKITKGDTFMPKKDCVTKSNPFQKLALQPTCFESSIDKNILIKIKDQAKQVGAFKLFSSLKNKQLSKSQQKTREDGLKMKSKLSQGELNKQNLPKIHSVNRSEPNLDKHSSEILKKKMEQYLLYQFQNHMKISQDQKHLQKIKYQFQHKRQYSLNIQKINHVNLDLKLCKNDSFNNLSYHVFIQKKQSKQAQEQCKDNKDKLLANILKKMKFK